MIETIRSQEAERLAVVLQRIRNRNVALDDELMSQVAAIIQDVRTRGDAALIDCAARFDGCVLELSDLRVGEDLLQRTANRVDAPVLEALREAIRRVRAFH